MTSTATGTAYTERHIVTLTKDAKRSLREDVLRSNVEAIADSIVSRSSELRGWAFVPATDTPWLRKPSNSREYEYVYEMNFVLNFHREDGQKPEAHELAAHLRKIATKVVQAKSGRWTLATVDHKPYEQSALTDDAVIQHDAMGYAPVEIPEDFESYFSHLYGLDGQIMRVRRALEAAVESDFANRYHCALSGDPGCGKSDVARSFKAALGDDAVWELDATATTSKGVIKELAEREILPRVIVIEEIEKAPEEAMSFLLAMLDQRSEIRKVTARETVQRDTKLFAICTVNNVERFNNAMAGALASRFANRVAFQRPSREVLRRILAREVAKVDGDEAWIEPTLDYCEKHSITDPRIVQSICLCGRDMLLTGEYQSLLEQTTPKEDQ